MSAVMEDEAKAQRFIWVAAGKIDLGAIRQQRRMTWAGYVNWLRKQYMALAVTTAAYAAMSPDEKQALKKKLTFSLGAKYRGTARKTEALELRETVNIDIDKQKPEIYEAVLAAARRTGYRLLHVGSSSNEVNGETQRPTDLSLKPSR